MKRFRTADRSRGFTLVELLVSMAMGTVLLTATYELLNTNSKLYFSKENTMVMTQDLRAAIDIAVREIRMAGCDPTGAGGIGFIDDANDDYDTDATSIRFTKDIDGDGFTTGTNEDINYYLYAQNGIQSLGRRTGGAVGLVAEYITALTFTYWDAGGTELTLPLSVVDLGNIYSVNITIAAETPSLDAVQLSKQTDSATTRVRVRNAGLL